MLYTVCASRCSNYDVVVVAVVVVVVLLREREINSQKEFQDPAGLKSKTFWILARWSYQWATWTPGRGVEDKLHKQHCLEGSAKFQLILVNEKNDTNTTLLLFMHTMNKSSNINLQCNSFLGSPRLLLQQGLSGSLRKRDGRHSSQ